MAKKKSGVNRTAKVKEYLETHPSESISEVLAGLAARGIKVSRSLISQVKKKLGQTGTRGTKMAKKKTAKKKASGAGAAQTAASAHSSSAGRAITADELYEAKKLADELGGIDRLRSALDALERLR